MSNWRFMNLFPELSDLEEIVKLEFVESFPEELGIQSVDKPLKDGDSSLRFFCSMEYSFLSLEEIFNSLGKENFDLTLHRIKEGYNKDFENLRESYPLTVDVYWQGFRRGAGSPLLDFVNNSLSIEEQDKIFSKRVKDDICYSASLNTGKFVDVRDVFNSSRDKSRIVKDKLSKKINNPEEINKFLSFDVEPEYVLVNSSFSTKDSNLSNLLEIPFYTFIRADTADMKYHSIWDLREKVAPKFSI